MRQGEALSSIVDLVFEQMLSQYCMHLLRKVVRTELLLCICNRWQPSAQACTWCLKSDMNKNKKNIKM